MTQNADHGEGAAERSGERGRVKLMFFPGCLVLSLVLSIGGTILINVLIRLFN